MNNWLKNHKNFSGYIFMLFMSMGREYVFELRLPFDLTTILKFGSKYKFWISSHLLSFHLCLDQILFSMISYLASQKQTFRYKYCS